ncbi:hypothetical protein DBA29_27980 [Xenophilus aerolatus]|nr:hypothetical protein [Xenophilus aerolatus]
MMHSMPAKNPRLTITLNPTLAATLRRLSELTGNSQSAVIGELLEGSEQVFAKIIRVLEAAEKAKAEVKGRAAANLEEAQGRMEAQLQLVMGEFDEYTGSLLADVEEVSRRARKGSASQQVEGGRGDGGQRSARRPPATVATPPSNRGVRNDPRTPKKPSRTRG